MKENVMDKMVADKVGGIVENKKIDIERSDIEIVL